MNQYRTVIGIVQFPPRDGEAADKPVRNIVVNATGFKEQAVRVSATLWPSHKDVEVAENDVVIMEGKYSKTNKNKDGQPITYHNLSVARIAVIGKADPGEQAPVDENDVEPEPDDDIPF